MRKSLLTLVYRLFVSRLFGMPSSTPINVTYSITIARP